MEQVEALIVAPYWPTQPCFSQILSLAPQESLIYIQTQSNKKIDITTRSQLAEKLSLIVAVLSGENIRN